MRGAHVLVPDIFHIIWFCEGSAVSQSVLHHFLSLKGLKRWGVRVSAFWSYSTLFGFGGEVMLYFSQLSTVFYHWRLVYNVFQCSVKGPKGQEVCMSAFWSYSTLFGFGRVLLYLSQFSTIFYHWRLVFNVFLCRLKDWRDEWCVSQCSQNIPHYLVLGGRLCCISVSSPLFFIIEGPEETRGSCVCILELFHIIWFWGGGYAVF